MGSTRQFQRPLFNLTPNKDDSTSISTSNDSSNIRSLPDLIHFNAVHNPDHVFCLQTKESRDASASTFDYTSITFFDLAHAVENCCNSILSHVKNVNPAQLGEDGSIQKSPPVALFLESDVGLFIHLAALLSLNIPAVLLSVRLSPAAVHQLLNETGAVSIIVSRRTRAIVQEAFPNEDETTIRVTNVIPFEQLLSTSNNLHRLFECRRIVREHDRNVLILHSSGTTGFPKAIFLTHRYLLGYAACHLFPNKNDESERGINLSTMPLFHGFGFLAPCLSLSVGKSVCLPPSSMITNSKLVVQLIREKHITSLMTVPTIMEGITLLDDFQSVVGELARLDFVAVGGGALKIPVGLMLHSKNVTILNHFGATEIGALAPIFRPDKDYDWRYLRLRTDLGLKLKPLDNKGSCKLIGYPFGWNSEIELQDDLECNPLNPESEVKILGRKDDLIVLATGEKVMPHLMEQILEQNSLIRRAIVFGTGQFEVGVLIEPLFTIDGEKQEFVDAIWPTVLKANDLVDQHARILTKLGILVKPVDKPIPLSDKGSPRRKEVYAIFSPEIQSIYKKLEREGSAVFFNPETPEKSLRAMVQMCLPAHNKPGTWGDEDDFIALGMDSLQATRLRRILNQSLQNQHVGHLPLDFVYSHPNVSKLTQAVQNSNSKLPNRLETMKNLAAKYALTSDEHEFHNRDHVILLTGSTGNLGAHLLQILGENPVVRQVICLTRTNNIEDFEKEAMARQQSVFENRGIALSKAAWLKIEFLSWKAGVAFLGLKKYDFYRLASIITHIFHGAWPMDFQRQLNSFEDQVQAVRDLVELGRSAHRLQPNIKPRIIFASSIAVVGQHSTKTVLELPVHDPRVSLPIGYAEAKWVGEKVMESAYLSSKVEVQPMIVRVGQLSGSNTIGYWSSKEHFPALVKAAQVLGRFPDLHGFLSWLPVDQAAQVISDLLLRSGRRDLVYHVENPIRQSWQDVCTIIERVLDLPRQARQPFKEWFSDALAAEGNLSDLRTFFENYFLHVSSGGLILDTRNSRAVSPTLKSTEAVAAETIELYVHFWRQSGFLK